MIDSEAVTVALMPRANPSYAFNPAHLPANDSRRQEALRQHVAASSHAVAATGQTPYGHQ
jgi:hypothetical protein